MPILILCAFGISFFKAQNWTTVWTESFNGLTRSSSYNNGVTGYWNNSANPPQNSQISGTFEATPANGIAAGTTQVPSDAAGGRFLMFWTQSGVTVPASENMFFKKTMTVVPGRTYRINYRFATLGAVPAIATNRANATFKVSPQGSTTSFYTSATVVADVNAWKNLQYEFTVPSSVTSIDMIWENTTKATTGNDFAIDDLLLEIATDSDADGMPDVNDLDDDNDGILDTVEGFCNTQTVYTLNIPSTLAGATFGANGGSFNLVYTLTSGTAVASLGNSFTVPFSYSDFNNSVNAQNHTWASFSSNATSFLIVPNSTSLYTGLPTNNTTSEDKTGASPDTPDGWFRYFLNTNRITQLGTFTTAIGNLPTVSGLSSYSSNIGLNLFSSFNASSSTLIDSGYYARMQLQTTTNTAGTGSTLPYATNYGNTYLWDYTAFSNTAGSGAGNAGRGLITISQNTITFCNHRDTDEDGIPDYLDLDSDNDGCVDALEGDENITNAQLATAIGTVTVGTGSTASNQNLGNTVDVNGVPTVVNSGGAADTGGDQGQGVGQSIDSSKNDCVDSDGDGVPDWQDLDDDNDGILDTVECPPTYVVRPVTSSSVTADKPITSGTAPQIADGEGAGGTGDGPFPNWYTNVSNLPIAFNMNMQSSSTIDHIKLYGPWGFNEWIGNFTIELYNAGNTLLGTENFVAPNQYTGTPVFSFTKEYTNVTRIRFTIVSSQGYSNVTPPRASVNEIVFLDLLPLTCDTDGDGILNHLDLDSDEDGCSDALEGGANINATQLVTAGGTVSGGSTTVTQNLCAGAGCVNPATGIPQFATLPSGYSNASGQSVGDSQNKLVNGCYCYKLPEKVAGNPNPVKHGITALNRAESDNSQWPQARQSAWTVLESKTKGFVVNRLTTSEIAAIPTANLVEGMMVYDKDAHCLKIYNGTLWSCFNTQTCPD